RVVAGEPAVASAGGLGHPVVLATSAAAVAEHPEALLEECFGPVTVLAGYADRAELDAAVAALPGALTATLHAAPGEDVAELAGRLAARAGRLLFSGWPTGVAVTWSQQHGGPWPASTSLHTSVGATAVRRFLRPLSYQDAPERLLPPELRDEGLARIPHRRNGVLRLP